MVKRILHISAFLFILLFYAVPPAAAQYFDTTTVEAAYPPVGGNTPFSRIKKSEVPVLKERKVADSLLVKLLQDEAFWYANAAVAKKGVKSKNNKTMLQWLNRQWIKSLLWILMIGAFAVVIVWYLLGVDIRLFRRRSVVLPVAATGDMPHDILAIAYEKEIHRAVQENDYAQAVRLHYLQTLKNLSVSNKIQYSQEQTNSDYLLQLADTDLHPDFWQLTRHFEYIWYGHFGLTTERFQKVQKDFKAFNQQLSS